MSANRILSPNELNAIGFARVGLNVCVDRAAVFINPEAIEIGNNVRVDAFALVSGGAGVRIGRNVHIATSAAIFGGGGVLIEDFAGISARSLIYSSNDDYSGAWLTGPTVPAAFSNVQKAPVRIGRHVVIGAGSIVLPGVTIGDGAAIGALSLVRSDVTPFTIAAGVPACVLKPRSRDLLHLERDFIAGRNGPSPSLEVHVPISPTPSFFTMVSCLAASIRAFAGSFGRVRIIVSIGEDCEPFDIERDHPELSAYGIEWRWTARDDFRRHSYFATGLMRWAEPFTSDYVLMADADILIVGPISELVQSLSSARSIAGCIATYPPFMARDTGDDRERWPELFAAAGLPAPRYDYAVPGYGLFYGVEHMSHAPPYYNFGFVFGARDAMNAIRTSFEADYLTAAAYMKTDLAAQAALCLSIVRHELDAKALPVRYNFWANSKYLEAFVEDAKDLRVLHYLHGPFRKHHDNHSIEDVKRWASEHRTSADELARFIASALDRVLDVAQKTR